MAPAHAEVGAARHRGVVRAPGDLPLDLGGIGLGVVHEAAQQDVVLPVLPQEQPCPQAVVLRGAVLVEARADPLPTPPHRILLAQHALPGGDDGGLEAGEIAVLAGPRQAVEQQVGTAAVLRPGEDGDVPCPVDHQVFVFVAAGLPLPGQAAHRGLAARQVGVAAAEVVGGHHHAAGVLEGRFLLGQQECAGQGDGARVGFEVAHRRAVCGAGGDAEAHPREVRAVVVVGVAEVGGGRLNAQHLLLVHQHADAPPRAEARVLEAAVDELEINGGVLG
ncbi:hypothetical protein Mrose_03530 [Calidithermus roseus]|uniref:Uncharacterized protein n=1 Tax=Calidithermus roseus TaxID=1644118 RepID=A0A399EBR9_9DEIN|nr:hypothetical protein Mrose_03530 [Calidithermus roseus]